MNQILDVWLQNGFCLNLVSAIATIQENNILCVYFKSGANEKTTNSHKTDQCGFSFSYLAAKCVRG